MPQNQKIHQNNICNILLIEDNNTLWKQLRNEIEKGFANCSIHTYSKSNFLSEKDIQYVHFDLIVFDYVGNSDDLDLLHYLQSASDSFPFPLMIISSAQDKVILLSPFGKRAPGRPYKNDVVYNLRDYPLSSLFNQQSS